MSARARSYFYAMKKCFPIAVWPLLLALQAQAQEHRDLQFNISGLKGDTVYLANYYGNRLFYADTAVAGPKGEVVFRNPNGLKSGVYAVVVPGPKFFEFIVNEPKIRMETSKDDLVGGMVVKTSEENRVFLAYMQFLNEKKAQADVVRERMNATSDPLLRSAAKEHLNELDREVKAYQKALMDENKGRFVAQLVRMSLPVELEQPLKEDGTVDSTAAYYQYRAHFWDHVDLTDPRILRAPVFQNKLEEYLDKVVPQVPDTINRLVDELIDELGDDPELFKYVVHNITYRYETSEIMGMDAVFAHMAMKYYCPKPNGSSRATWMSEEKLAKLCERAEKLSPLVIGSVGTELILPDTTEEKWISSHKLPHDFVVLCFWDPHCGHCKKDLPELRDIYHDRLKALNTEVYAVAKATDSVLFSDWKKFIRKEDLDWVNVGLTWHVYPEAKKDPYKFIPALTTIESLNYADTYDVFATPKIFILDKDRKIIGKQLSPDQIADLIERVRERRPGSIKEEERKKESDGGPVRP